MRALKHSISIGTIIDALGGELRGDPQVEVSLIASLDRAMPGSISFLSNPKYLGTLAITQATVIILQAEHASHYSGNVIITPDPYLYFAKLTQWWKKLLLEQYQSGSQPISEHAIIHPTASIAATAIIGPAAVIDAYAVIGDGVRIGAQSYIGQYVSIGENCIIAPHVTILNECQIGKRTIINSGAVIGGDGFGFAPAKNEVRRWVKIEQLGSVQIGDDVEIGANTCVDRGAVDDTIIGDGVKLDNVIQIAHNVQVGDDTLMASCVGISGSTHIGKRCIIGGAVGAAGHLQVVDDVVVMAATNITKSITQPGVYSGIIPFDEAQAWRKNAALLKHLSSMRDRIRELEKQLSQLTTKLEK